MSYEPVQEAQRSSIEGEVALLFAVVAAALLALLLASQMFAWQVGYRPEIGTPAGHVGAWPLYGPFEVLGWWKAWRGVPELGSVFLLTYAAGGVGFALTFMGGLALRARGGKRVASGSHGTAEWGKGRALRVPEGHPLGRAEDGALLRYADGGHVLTLASTGSGKMVSVVGPVLLDYLGSAFVVDPAPEVAAVTARRRRQMGQRVEVFDLDGGETAGVNPLDHVRRDMHLFKDATLIAELIVAGREQSTGSNKYFDDKALEFCAAVIAYVVCHLPPERQNLIELRKLISRPSGGKDQVLPGTFEELIAQMVGSEEAYGMISETASSIASMPHKEWSGVINNLRQYTSFLADPLLWPVFSRSTFDMGDLKRHRLTVYVCLPAETMDANFRAIRLLMGCAVIATKRVPGKPTHKMLMMAEEFQNLGRMQIAEREIAVGRKAGWQWWLIVQDPDRLQAVYGNAAGTFFSNTDVLQVFGVGNNAETLRRISELTGDTTILVHSDNENKGRSSGGGINWKRSRSQGGSVSETGRKLLTPSEVRTMPPEEEVVFIKGRNPIKCRKPNYLTDPEWRGQFDPNPQHGSVSRVGHHATR